MHYAWSAVGQVTEHFSVLETTSWSPPNFFVVCVAPPVYWNKERSRWARCLVDVAIGNRANCLIDKQVLSIPVSTPVLQGSSCLPNHGVHCDESGIFTSAGQRQKPSAAESGLCRSNRSVKQFSWKILLSSFYRCGKSATNWPNLSRAWNKMKAKYATWSKNLRLWNRVVSKPPWVVSFLVFPNFENKFKIPKCSRICPTTCAAKPRRKRSHWNWPITRPVHWNGKRSDWPRPWNRPIRTINVNK